MAIKINVYHHFPNDDAALQQILSKLDQIIEKQGSEEELRKLAADLKTGNDALREAIEKNKGNIAQT